MNLPNIKNLNAAIKLKMKFDIFFLANFASSLRSLRLNKLGLVGARLVGGMLPLAKVFVCELYALCGCVFYRREHQVLPQSSLRFLFVNFAPSLRSLRLNNLSKLKKINH